MTRPTVGRIVHVADSNPPRWAGQPYMPVCRAAIVVEQEGDLVGLAVFLPGGTLFRPIIRGDRRDGPGANYCPGVVYEPTGACECGHFHEPGYETGSWHWPERVES